MSPCWAPCDPDQVASTSAPSSRREAVGFKLSLFGTDAIASPRIPDDQFLEVLSAIGEHGSVACVHAENEEIIKPLLARARDSGETSPLAHCRSRPPVSETQAVLTALEYARETRAPLQPVPPEPCPVGRSRPVLCRRRPAGEHGDMPALPDFLRGKTWSVTADV